MMKFILPAVILLTLTISSQALACRPYLYNYTCEVKVVYQGATLIKTSVKVDVKEEVDRVREETGSWGESLMQKIAQDLAKADACKALCEGEEACVSSCLSEAKFSTLRCEWNNACAGWPGPRKNR